MSDKVVSITGDALLQSDRRELFVRTLTEAFDQYTRDYGEEPEAFVFVLNGLTQISCTGWHVTGASEAGLSSVLALAAVHMLRDAQGDTGDAE